MKKQAKSDYYAGGIRFLRDGVPCKVAPWVKELTDRSRAEFMRGSFGNLGTSTKAREVAALARHPQTTYIPREA